MNIQLVLSRLNEKLTDEEIGKAIGAPQATVNRLRNGRHKQTSFSRGVKIAELAKRYGVDVNAA